MFATEYERLAPMQEDGSIHAHCDWRVKAYMT